MPLVPFCVCHGCRNSVMHFPEPRSSWRLDCRSLLQTLPPLCYTLNLFSGWKFNVFLFLGLDHVLRVLQFCKSLPVLRTILLFSLGSFLLSFQESFLLTSTDPFSLFFQCVTLPPRYSKYTGTVYLHCWIFYT